MWNGVDAPSPVFFYWSELSLLLVRAITGLLLLNYFLLAFSLVTHTLRPALSNWLVLTWFLYRNPLCLLSRWRTILIKMSMNWELLTSHSYKYNTQEHRFRVRVSKRKMEQLITVVVANTTLKIS